MGSFTILVRNHKKSALLLFAGLNIVVARQNNYFNLTRVMLFVVFVLYSIYASCHYLFRYMLNSEYT